jgi:tetratricopeptide (TPR) repeat protein
MTLLPLVLIRNSFNILGLSSSTSLKEIRKRSQQLLQLAKIEEIQEFETDIGHVRELRNESEVKLALERISGIKERLREIFFWFDDHNIVNQKSLILISQGRYQEAIDILDKINIINIDWLHYKNLALALMFKAFASSDLNIFCRSLELWKQITVSEDFWKFYEKHYLFHDEFGTSSSLFEEFKGSIYESLSAKAVSFFHQTRNPEAIGLYYSAFGQLGQVINTEILQPIILKIKQELEDLVELGNDLKACALGELLKRPVVKYDTNASSPPPEMDGTIVCKETQEDLIKRSLKRIHRYFLELDKFELSEYSPLAVLRDNSAEKLRSICIDIYNDNCSPEIALILLEQGSKIAVSEAIAIKIEADKKTIKETQVWKTVADRFEMIKELIVERKIQEAENAFLTLDNELSKNNDESFIAARINLIMNFCSYLMAKGHQLFEKKMFGIKTLAIDGLLNWSNHRDAIRSFDHAFEILTDRLHLLSFTNSSNDRSNISKTLESISISLRTCEITSVADYHDDHLETIDELASEQENENTQIIIRMLGSAACFRLFYRRFRSLIQMKTWKWIGWTSIGLYFLFIIGNPSEKPAKKSTYRSNTSYTSPASLSLTFEEKKAIEFLQKNKLDELRKVRKEGYSDKQIAQYWIEHQKSRKNDKAR